MLGPIMVRHAACLLISLALVAQERMTLTERAPDHRFRFLPELHAPGERPLALALRGGSAKGLAHAGVLRRLDEEGWHPEGLVGTSAGSLAAAIYACGFGGAGAERIFAGRDFAAVLDDRRRAPGLSLSEDEGLHGTVISLAFAQGRPVLVPGEDRARRLRLSLMETLARGQAFGTGTFDDLGTRLRIVASSLTRGEARVLRGGSLAEAVQASMSIPGLLSPVALGGELLVDGGLVENMPVLAARESFPGAAVVGVNIGRSWDDQAPTDLLALLGRSLDLAMRVTESRSEAAAEAVLRPDTDAVPEFDYKGQEGELFAAGARAVEAALPKLEALLLPGAEQPVAAALRVEGPEDPHLTVLLPPSGPLRKLDLWRLLRRAHRQLPVGRAWVDLPADPRGEATFHWEPAPTLTRVDLILPPGWAEPSKAAVAEQLRAAGLVVGQPFHAARFGRLEQELAAAGLLRGAGVLDFKGSGFEAGVLRLQVREPILARVDVAPGRSREAIAAMVKPLEGRIVRARELEDLLARARDRMGHRRLETALSDSPEGLVLHLRPLGNQPTTLSATLAYESDWGIHGGLEVQGRNLFDSGLGGSLQVEGDSLQKQLRMQVGWTPGRLPALSLGLFGSHVRQEVRGGLLFLTQATASLDLAFTRQELGLEAQIRWGAEDRGRLGLAVLEQRGTLRLLDVKASTPRAEVVRAWFEWDDLDFHTLPDRGTALRLTLDRSVHQDDGALPYQRLYALATRHQPLAWGLGLMTEAEVALEHQAPPDRWWVAGGSNSFIGTRSAAYLLPNFAALRVGLPYTRASLFGTGWQVGPRLDLGRTAAVSNELREGIRMEGTGLVAKTVLRDFFLELSAGRVNLHLDAFRVRESRVSVLFGARPFTTWKRK